MANLSQILVIAGNSPEIGHQSRVAKHFYHHTRSFFKELFGAEEIHNLNNILQFNYNNNKGYNFFSDPYCVTPYYHNTACYAASVPIFDYEIKKAGYTPVFAALDDIFENFFVLDLSTEITISPYWQDKLDGINIVIISTTLITSYVNLSRIINLLKKQNKVILIGGILICKLSKDNLVRLNFDYALTVEAENTLSRLLSIIASKKDLTKSLSLIPGLTFRRNGKLFQNNMGITPVEFGHSNYSPQQDWITENKGVIPYQGTRGCPYKCSFCSHPNLLGKKSLVFRDAKKILQDWELLASLGTKHINCVDSSFTSPKTRLAELCKMLISSGLNKQLTWTSFARAYDLIDPDLVALVKESGCRYLCFGTESGSQLILDNMNKQTTVAQNKQALNNCDEVGIFSTTSLIIGFPGETSETIQQTERFIVENSVAEVFLHVWVPDFSPHSKVPIMQPDVKRKFNIQESDISLKTQLNYYGQNVDFEFGFNWKHSTMNLEQSLYHALYLSDKIRKNSDRGDEYYFSPYRLFFRHASTLSMFLDYKEHLNFVLGMKNLFNKFLAGQDVNMLRQSIPAWLKKSGIKKRSLD